MIKAVLIHTSILTILYLLLYRRQSKKAYFINIFISIWFMYINYTYMPWTKYGSAYLKYAYLLLFVAGLIISLKYSKNIDKTRLALWFKIGKYLLKSFLIFFMVYVSIIEIGAIITPKTKFIKLDFPLKRGEYYISSGGNNTLLNYHQGLTESYYHKAFDISKLGTYGTTQSTNPFTIAKNNEDFYIFSDSIFSPCDGLVTTVRSSETDHEPGDMSNFENQQANVVAIKTGNNFVILAHFKQNTIVVDSADLIKKGQFLGLVGNSGHSSSPHLHGMSSIVVTN